MAHSVTWFDIPVLDIERAIRFYTAVMGIEIEKESHGDKTIGVLPHRNDEVGGCLYPASSHRPSADGPLLYLNVDKRMDAAVAAVRANGGKVLQEKHAIGEYGWRAIVLDSEGNRLALHAAT